MAKHEVLSVRGAWILGAVVWIVQVPCQAQHTAELVPHRTLMPAPRQDAGYLTPPMALYGSNGAVALDGMDRRIAVLDRAGDATRVIGSFGEGPGQFYAASSLMVRGDSLILTDASLPRATVFDLRTGGVIATWPIDLETRWGTGLLRPSTVFTEDCWVGTYMRGIRQPANPRQPVRMVSTGVRVRKVGRRIQADSILFVDNRNATIHPLGELAISRVPSAVATRTQFLVGADGRSFATVMPVHGRRPGAIVQRWTDACGPRTDSLFVPLTPRELSTQDVVGFYRLKLANRSLLNDNLDAAVEDAVEQTERVRGRFFAPLYTAALLAADGAVWIETEGVADLADFGRPRVWRRVSAGSASPTTIIVPARVRLQAANAERAIGWLTSDNGGHVVELRWK